MVVHLENSNRIVSNFRPRGVYAIIRWWAHLGHVHMISSDEYDMHDALNTD